ncbi:hypothetical protein E1293_44620 [Actinomadura darangshiensis]|uniref:Uncharacterized protein n=2 Tax=Actinomadura darangshiensis TaxID=705336 RepID=A0A4R4ZUH4_9ACTN|nr:hypothetical protein E1293_44620 [Actinomadura darangshiensis]
MGMTARSMGEMPDLEWRMVALVHVPWREFSSRWEIPFEGNERWEAPGPVAHAVAHSQESAMWYLLEHHFDYRQPGVYVSVPAGTENPLEVLARDLDLSAEFITAARA